MYRAIIPVMTFFMTQLSAGAVGLELRNELSAASAQTPLVLLTIVAGLLDGFNPCALFILLFLLSVLLTENNRKKIIIYGGVFILASGLTYFFILLGFVRGITLLPFYMKEYLEIAVGVLGLTLGLLSLYSAYRTRPGCKVMDNERRKTFFHHVTYALNHDNMFIGLALISAIAVVVNLLEMFCSIGIPVQYAAILSNAEGLTTVSIAGLLILYILMFLFDHFVVFGVAVVSKKIIGISNKQTFYIKILGGLLMIVLGVIMLTDPSLLNAT